MLSSPFKPSAMEGFLFCYSVALDGSVTATFCARDSRVCLNFKERHLASGSNIRAYPPGVRVKFRPLLKSLVEKWVS